LRSWTLNISSKGSGYICKNNLMFRLRSELVRDAKREQNLFREISLIVLDTTVLFLKDFGQEMLQRNSIFFSKVWSAFTRLLSKNQSVSFLSALFATVAYLIAEFKRFDIDLILIYI
jgi:hypothetical protein